MRQFIHLPDHRSRLILDLDSTVVARMNTSLKRRLCGLRYQRLNAQWEIAECEHKVSEQAPPRRCVVARRLIEETEPQPTLFTLERYADRAWMTNLPLTPAGIWHFYDGRAGMEPRIGELREHFALRKIPTRAFDANALYLEIIRLAYNLVAAFQRTCLPEDWLDAYVGFSAGKESGDNLLSRKLYNHYHRQCCV